MNTPWTDAEIVQLEGFFRDAPGSRVFAPLADSYRDRGRVEDALVLLKRGTAQHPDYVSALVLQALCELQLGHVEDAEATYARVTELDPENLMALKYRADRSASRGGIEQARALLQQVLEIDPFDAQARAAQEHLVAPTPETTAVEPLPEIDSDAARFDALGAVPESPEAVPADALPALPGEPGEPDVDIRPAMEDPIAPEFEAEVTSDADSFDVLGLGARPSSAELPAPPEADAVDADAVPPLEPETPHVEPDGDSHGTPLADWHVQRADDRIVVRQGPDPGPGESELAPPARPTDEFSTLTLARIYESQGYLDKALAIYQKLHERHPDHPEVLERLHAVQERMAGFEAASDPAPHVGDPPGLEFVPAPESSEGVSKPSPEPRPEPTAAGDPAEPTVPSEDEVPRRSGSAWRLLDVEALDAEPQHAADELRDLADGVRAREVSKRHTVIGSPDPSAGDASASPVAEPGAEAEPDFERFLRYVRSIKR